MNTKTHPKQKIKRLGHIGRIASVLTILFLIVFLIIDAALDLHTSRISEFLAIVGFDIRSPAHFEKHPGEPYIDLFNTISLFIGACLSYAIFHEFSKGHLLTKKIATRVQWTGIWCLISSLWISYEHREIVTSENPAENTRTVKHLEEIGFSVLPELIIIGLIILSFGIVIKYAIDLEEENSLTI